VGGGGDGGFRVKLWLKLFFWMITTLATLQNPLKKIQKTQAGSAEKHQEWH
jgi:hypothetical protein